MPRAAVPVTLRRSSLGNQRHNPAALRRQETNVRYPTPRELTPAEQEAADAARQERRERRRSSAWMFEKFTSELRAATIIGRAWRKRTRGQEMDRFNFAERLILEDDVCVGVTRLLLFVVLFLILYQVTLIGVHPGERRAAEIVLMEALNLEDFASVRTLPAYREEMVKFSHAIKEFSASGSERFPDEESLVVGGSAESFNKPKPLSGLDLNIATEEFTMTAWVEVTDESHADKSILRKPLSTHPGLSCWGWYFPSKLTYGAHDYHSVGMDMDHSWQVAVEAGSEFPEGFFNHEAVVVHNHSATFYRNGKELNPGGTPLPRTITDCNGMIEIGSPGLKLSSVKFYARALNHAEIQEITVNGQPLSEIATGSSLPHYSDSEHAGIVVEVDTVAHHTDELLEHKDEKRVLDDVVADAELGESEALVEAALFPPDPSPVATLPPSEPASFLPYHDLHEWERAGSPRNLSRVLVDRWTCDSLLLPPSSSVHRRAASAPVTASGDDDFVYNPTLSYDATEVCGGGGDGPDPGAYWSIVDDPMYAKASRDEEEDVFHESHDKDPLVAMNLSGVPDDATALTFTFWTKAVRPEDPFSLLLRIGEYGELDTLGFQLLSYGAAVLRVTDPHGHSWAQLAEDMFAANQVEGPLDEKFFITAFNHDAIPTTWRHVAVVFHLDEGFHESYLDGRLIKRHEWHAVSHIPISYLRGKSLSVTQAPWWHNANKTLAKIGQLRMYPRALSQLEVQNLQDNSRWGEGSVVKQCHEVGEDKFMDSDGVDSHGRSCSWYHEMMEHTGSNLICKSVAAKKLCPLTCRGQRECSSGYPFNGHVHDHYHDWLVSHSHRHYRIFDRIVHLKPRGLNSTSGSPLPSQRRASAGSASSALSNASEDFYTVICPGSSLDVDRLLAACRDPITGNASYPSLLHFYETWEESVEDAWDEYHRADLTQCEELEKRIDAHQCEWDDSWVPDFMHDLHEMEQFSVHWWSRPADTARLPVTALNMFATMVPPRTLLDVREQNIFQEAMTRLAVPTSDGQLWSSARHRGTIDFQQHWTFYYVKLQKLKHGPYAGEWQVCLAVNGFPLDCHHSAHLTDFEEHPGQPFPETFLEAFEVATEVMISPIEFSTDVLSVSEVQELYYRLAPKMARVTGPRTSELERMSLRDTPPEKAAKSFSERLLVAAPPLVYQQRNIEEDCTSKAMGTFLGKQLDLILNTHCLSGTDVDVCPGFHQDSDVYACKGSERRTGGFHYGRPVSLLNTTDPPTHVFADFLFSIADNDVLVRGEDHDILPAVEFVDRATDEAVILCLFHSPDTGDTTVLDVRMVADGSKLTVLTEFSHFGYLRSADREVALTMWSVFFALCAIALLWNLALLRHLYLESREFEERGWDTEHVGECVYDLLQVALLVGYGVAKTVAQMASEQEAMDLVGEFVTVPFRDSSETVESKVNRFFDAITTMRILLSSEKALQTVGFFVMLLMLIRIMNATAVHPRIGVLIGTVRQGIDDLWHFAIMFLLVFVFASMVSSWAFGTRKEYEDLQTSMQTQFDMLLGNLPRDYASDPLLIIYITLSIVVQFFLMLNFLLAIVVESYMKVRNLIEEMETENEFTYDVWLTLRFFIEGTFSGWPNRRKLGRLLQQRCARKQVSWIELHVLGVPRGVAKGIIDSYKVLEVLRGRPHEESSMDMDRLGALVEKRMTALEDNLNGKLEAVLKQLQASAHGPASEIVELPAAAQSVDRLLPPKLITPKLIAAGRMAEREKVQQHDKETSSKSLPGSGPSSGSAKGFVAGMPGPRTASTSGSGSGADHLGGASSQKRVRTDSTPSPVTATGSFCFSDSREAAVLWSDAATLQREQSALPSGLSGEDTLQVEEAGALGQA